MFNYVVKRILLTLLILFGVSVILYGLVRLMPSDYVDMKYSAQLAQGTMQQADLDRMKELYGLLDNSFVGILKGYWKWFTKFISGDMGQSFIYGDKVSTVIGERMWYSFGFSLVSTIFQFAISIPLGIKAAVNQYGVLDYTVTIIVMIGISLPTFFMANLAIKIFAVDLGWLPIGGMKDPGLTASNSTAAERFFDTIKHFILPVLVLLILSLGGLMRHTRTNTLEVLNADYIRTARAKGLSERSVIYKHAFRNTLVPLATMFAGILPGLFSGAMITEEVFSIEGIGLAAYKATTQGDVPFIMGYNMFVALLTVIGTFLSDIMYSIVDPRVKLVK